MTTFKTFIQSRWIVSISLLWPTVYTLHQQHELCLSLDENPEQPQTEAKDEA